ncbi:MAG: DUF2851 family protein [Bacteroidota bacterium]
MKVKLKEELLHYLWQMKRFDQNDLRTTSGLELSIQAFGQLNHDAGPDFNNGRILVDGTSWVGHIEMHLLSSDWYRHRHHDDPAYDNVVLHVVYHHDREIIRRDGTTIPCLELESRIDQHTLDQYQSLLSTRNWVPCEKHLSTVSELTKRSTLDRMLAERLAQKAQLLATELEQLNGDLATLIYQRFAYSLGLTVNASAMQRLARCIPYRILAKHRDDLFQLESLLFGTSGLIPSTHQDDYVNALRREFAILRSKYELESLQAVEWKYFKLRPAAFPTIRIAQLAKLIHQIPRLDDLLIQGSVSEIHTQMAVKAEGFWKYHYTWDTASSPRAKTLGKSKREVIIINTVAPILWLIGETKSEQRSKDKAIHLLESVKGEKNHITNKWAALGMPNESAMDSQGLVHLKKQFCNQSKCLACPVGVNIMSQ